MRKKIREICAKNNAKWYEGGVPVFWLLKTLFDDPIWFLEYSLYRVPAVLIALVLHEWAHGYVAYRLGDPTAKMMGRLTLNPLKHLDPIGAFLLFFAGFGWAKPVPVDPGYYKHPRRDDLLVSIAGITMNLLLFLLFTVIASVVSRFLFHEVILQNYSLHELLGYKDGFINAILAGGGKDAMVIYAKPELLWVLRLTSQIALMNLGIGIFNLFPFPPLDGFHILNDFVLKGELFAARKAQQFGILIIFALSYIGWLGDTMTFLIDNVQAGVLSVIARIIGA